MTRHPAHHRVLLSVTAALSLAWASGCGDFEPNGVGESCLADSDCTLRLCDLGICLDPGEDDDGDGISNYVEHLWGGRPRSTDSDLDGVSDTVEFGTGDTPRDTDGDGKPDFVESRLLDADRDCIVDERDADDLVASEDTELIRELSCPHAGVCSDQLDVIVATCSAGVLTCDYSLVVGFEGFFELSCDGIDGDCDGLADEDFSYGVAQVGGLCALTSGCGTGTVICAAGGLSATCSLDPSAPAGPGEIEVCDGVDNDCDGQTDEDQQWQGVELGSPCTGGGVCASAPGVVECQPLLRVAVCSTAPGGSQAIAESERCDGADNDCDGQTDEDVYWESPTGELLGKGATCGLGACEFGVVACSADEHAVCSSESQATTELCDGVDNDCDGLTDEEITYFGLPPGAPCQGLGECGAGVVECVVGAPIATCSTHANGSSPQATPEMCDGLDNDCDGLTDETLAWQGLPVGSTCEGACGLGAVACSSSGEVNCSTNPGGSEFQPEPEECNGVDDNCDGTVDEGLPLVFGEAVALAIAPPTQGFDPWPRRDATAWADASGPTIWVAGGTASASETEPPVWKADVWAFDVDTLAFTALVTEQAAVPGGVAGPLELFRCEAEQSAPTPSSPRLNWLRSSGASWSWLRPSNGAWVAVAWDGDEPIPSGPVADVACAGEHLAWAVPRSPEGLWRRVSWTEDSYVIVSEGTLAAPEYEEPPSDGGEDPPPPEPSPVSTWHAASASATELWAIAEHESGELHAWSLSWAGIEAGLNAASEELESEAAWTYRGALGAPAGRATLHAPAGFAPAVAQLDGQWLAQADAGPPVWETLGSSAAFGEGTAVHPIRGLYAFGGVSADDTPLNQVVRLPLACVPPPADAP